VAPECRELTSVAPVLSSIPILRTQLQCLWMWKSLSMGTGNALPHAVVLNPDAASVNVPVPVESVGLAQRRFSLTTERSHDTWTCLDGNEANSGRQWGGCGEKEVASLSTREQHAVRRGSWWLLQDRFRVFPWRDHHGLGFGFDWVHTMVPDLVRWAHARECRLSCLSARARAQPG